MHFTGNVDKVKRLIDEGVDVNTLDSDDEAPIHNAAFRGKKISLEAFFCAQTVFKLEIVLCYVAGELEIVKVLIEKGGAAVDIKDGEEQTPLMNAVKSALFRNVFANSIFISIMLMIAIVYRS